MPLLDHRPARKPRAGSAEQAFGTDLNSFVGFRIGCLGREVASTERTKGQKILRCLTCIIFPMPTQVCVKGLTKAGTKLITVDCRRSTNENG